METLPLAIRGIIAMAGILLLISSLVWVPMGIGFAMVLILERVRPTLAKQQKDLLSGLLTDTAAGRLKWRYSGVHNEGRGKDWDGREYHWTARTNISKLRLTLSQFDATIGGSHDSIFLQIETNGFTETLKDPEVPLTEQPIERLYRAVRAINAFEEQGTCWVRPRNYRDEIPCFNSQE